MVAKFVLNSKGVRELLVSSELSAHLKERADKIAAAAGPGHEVRVDKGPNRARAVVLTATPEARRSEATNRTLTRAIEAGRD